MKKFAFLFIVFNIIVKVIYDTLDAGVFNKLKESIDFLYFLLTNFFVY